MSVLLGNVLYNQPSVGYRGYILFATEIFRVTIQVDRSLAGTNAASYAYPCLPLIQISLWTLKEILVLVVPC